jgi:trimethylamine--corrinoid protein Co-methyltransferase
VARHIPERGCAAYLCQSAKLCNALPNADFFIRNVNLQDEDITADNKDVNVFMAALMHMAKHVQAGLVNLGRLDEVLTLAGIAAGGAEKLAENPVISFITCLIKSPLQMVDDTTEKVIAIAERGMPLVISSSPQGGSTAPIREEGMVAMINAEILAGITLTQVVNPGTPVLYGAVPVRARLDTLHDLYGAPEFIHYNIDCVQMARHYGVPCYSTAGIGDAKVPGLQSTIEKVFSQLAVASSGAQYIHYAFGLLEKTNIFSPLQAVLDDEHIGLVRHILRRPAFGKRELGKAVQEIRQVFASSSRLFARHIRKAIRAGLVSPPYAFETAEERDEVLARAHGRLTEILVGPEDRLSDPVIEAAYGKVPGLLPVERFRPAPA